MNHVLMSLVTFALYFVLVLHWFNGLGEIWEIGQLLEDSEPGSLLSPHGGGRAVLLRKSL